MSVKVIMRIMTTTGRVAAMTTPAISPPLRPDLGGLVASSKLVVIGLGVSWTSGSTATSNMLEV